MIRIFLITGFLCLFGAGTSNANIVLLDFDDEGSAPTLGGEWNTFGTLDERELINSNGDATGITISFSGMELGGDNQGVWSAGDKEWVDGDATTDFFFTRAVGTVTFSGLQVGSAWRFDAVAARNRSFQSRTGDYTINGSFGDSTPNGDNFNARLDGWDSGHIMSWNSVVADQNGEITLTVSQVSNFAYLNSSRLTAVPEPSTLACFTLAIACGLGVRRRRS